MMKFGSYFEGPDSHGCFNSGMAPVIARSKRLRDAGHHQYFVCRMCDIGTVVRYRMTDGNSEKPLREFFIFGTEKAAMKQYKKWCDEMVAANKETVEHERKLREEIKRIQMTWV